MLLPFRYRIGYYVLLTTHTHLHTTARTKSVSLVVHAGTPSNDSNCNDQTSKSRKKKKSGSSSSSRAGGRTVAILSFRLPCCTWCSHHHTKDDTQLTEAGPVDVTPRSERPTTAKTNNFLSFLLLFTLAWLMSCSFFPLK